MKEEILKTSLSQFLKYGIREMSIQKLVEPLGISTKTVYKYFKNKEDLLEEVLYFMQKENGLLFEQMVQSSDPVALFAGIWYTAIEAEYNINKVFFHDLHYYYPLLHAKNEARLSRKYKKQFIEILKHGMEEGYFHDTINPEVVFEGVSIFYRAITREGLFHNFRVPSHAIFFNTIYVYIRGCCTGNGERLLQQYWGSLKTTEKQQSKERKAGSKV